MDKYTVPKLPNAQHILEDLSDPDIIKADKPLNASVDDEIVRNAYSCYQSYKQLDFDVQKQSSLSSNLEELNEQLVENIGNMKKQMHAK